MNNWSCFFEEDSPYRWGAVLISLFEMPQGFRLPLILRPDFMKIHGGQIAFPGGAVELGDATPWDTACREAYEEIGVEKENLEYLGFLEPEDVLVSKFKVIPVVARGRRPMVETNFTPNSSEVSQLIFYDPCSMPSKPDITVETYRGSCCEYPVYPLDEGLSIWGATARMLRRVCESGLLTI